MFFIERVIRLVENVWVLSVVSGFILVSVAYYRDNRLESETV